MRQELLVYVCLVVGGVAMALSILYGVLHIYILWSEKRRVAGRDARDREKYKAWKEALGGHEEGREPVD